MWTKIFILSYLGILGIRDWRERKVPMWWLLAGGIVLFGVGIYRCFLGEFVLLEMLLGTLPGALLLVIAWFTGKAGYADGLVLLELGACLGYREGLFLFAFGLLLLSAVSVILLFLGKVKKNTKMPYLSFLAIVYLLQQL